MQNSWNGYKLWTNLCKLFANQNQTNRHSSGKSGKSKRHDRRSLRLEPLEERQLLAVTTAEFGAVRSQYADLNLSANMAGSSVMEVTGLTEANLQNAVTAAAPLTVPDTPANVTATAVSTKTVLLTWDAVANA
ncbi:MAG: hypothetical protein FWC50_02585, partial [Planctomycetaceae bacterium]|nr:hypothetical protein [Planctomycetaceae bacterium]